jgi:hypothetical protein
VAVIKICRICNDEIEDIDKVMLRRIRKDAMKFPRSKLKEMARLTTIMRIKAIENKNS